MVTFTEVRAALESSDPWAGMHILVTRELNEGERLKALADQFKEFFPQVDDLNLPDDGQDAFGDTYDAIVGHCRPIHRYQERLKTERVENRVPTLSAESSEQIPV